MEPTNLTNLTLTELQSLIENAKAEIIRRGDSKIRIAVTFGSYNARRYSRPWIARITSWPVGGTPELAFGSYVGNNGGGEVEIMARRGDIIR